MFTRAFVQFSAKNRIISSASGDPFVCQYYAGEEFLETAGQKQLGIYSFQQCIVRSPLRVPYRGNHDINRYPLEACATNSAWRLPDLRACVQILVRSLLIALGRSMPDEYTVFISALWFAPNSNAGLSVIERHRPTMVAVYPV